MTHERPAHKVMDFQESFADARIRCQSKCQEGMDLLTVIEHAKPDVLIGLSGVGGAFKKEHIQAMCANKE
jgi:malic enzyme